MVREVETVSLRIIHLMTLLFLMFLTPRTGVWASPDIARHPAGATQEEQTSTSSIPPPQRSGLNLTDEERAFLDTVDVLRIQNEADWPPFDFNRGGIPQGFAIDFARLLGATIGKPVEFVTGHNWQEYLTMIKTGELDLLTNIVDTPERRSFMSFTAPYMDAGGEILVVREEDAGKYENPEDFTGRTITAVRGYSDAEYYRTRYPGVNLLLTGSTLESLKSVAEGHADATVTSEAVVRYLIDEHMLTGLALEVPSDLWDGTADQQRIGVRKDWPLMPGILSKAINAIPDARLERLLRKWNIDQSQDLKALNLTPEEWDFLSTIDVLRVNSDADWPPFNFQENGVPRGYAIDFLNSVAHRIGLQIDYIKGPTWAEFLVKLRKKELDVIVTVNPVSDRQAYMEFSAPFINPDYVIVIRDADRNSIKNFDDLRGKKVAVPKGWAQEEFLRSYFPNVEIFLTETGTEAFHAVANGTADATLSRTPVFRHFSKTHSHLNLTRTKNIGPAITNMQPMTMGVRKDWPMLASILTKAIYAFPADELNKLKIKWYIEQPPGLEGLNLTAGELDFLSTLDVLRVNNLMDWPPYDFNENGTSRGYSVDFITSIAQHLGLKVEFVHGRTWAEFLAMLKNMELDILLNVVRSPERESYMLFSSPYLTLDIALITRRIDDERIRSLDDLTGKTLSVTNGTWMVELLQVHHPEIKLLFANSELERLQAVTNGVADATLGRTAVFRYFAQKHNLQDLVAKRFTDATSQNMQSLAMGTRRDWPLLAKILTKAIYAFPPDKLRELRQKWLLDEVPQVAPTVTLTRHEEAWLQNHPRLTVANLINAPPFDFIENTVPRGIAPDIVNQLAENLGVRLEQKQFNSAHALSEAIAAGEVDIFQMASIHDERWADLKFTSPILRSQQVILSRTPSEQSLGLEDFDGQSIGISDFLYSEQLFNHYPSFEFQLIGNIEDGIRALREKEIDAFVTSVDVARHQLQKDAVQNIHMVGRVSVPSIESLFGIGVPDNKQLLLGILQKALDAMDPDEMTAIHRKWLGELAGRSIATGVRLTTEERQFLQENHTLKLCVTPGYMPFETATPTGQHIGIAADYMRLVASRLGIKLDLVISNGWSETMDFAYSRKCDFTALPRETEKRKKYLDFTRSYFEAPNVLVTRDDEQLVANLDAVIDQPLSVGRSSATLAALERDYPDKSFVPVDSVEEGLRRVSAGREFGHIAVLTNVTYLINKTRLSNLKITGHTPYDYKMAVGARNDQPLLTSIFDKAIATISDAEHQEIFARWNRIRVEGEVDYTLIWRASAVLALILIAITAWNRNLARVNTQLAEAHSKLEQAHAELQNTQQQLVMQEKMASLGTLTSGVAHEINNPANFTYASAHLIHEELDRLYKFLRNLAGGDKADDTVLASIKQELAKLHAHADTASEGARRIKNIVKDLRIFTRLDEAEKSDAQIADVVSSTVHLIRTQHTDIDFITQLDFNPEYECFPSKLSQVFMNILVNACDAIAERQQQEPDLKGTIAIRSMKSGQYLLIEIEDNGCGMSEATQDKLFEPFFTTKDVGTGTGLGMAISFGVMQDHGGDIAVTSAIGKGSNFVIRLPL